MSRATYQLSLLGDAPKKGREWKPLLRRWTFCGIPIPPDDDARRQAEMLTRETRDWHPASRPEGRASSEETT